jgi:methionyl aminopeptidase
MIVLKSPSEIEIMGASGAIIKECFEYAREAIKPGKTRNDLDLAIEKIIRSQGAKPAFKGFQGFPASTCISVNEEVVHGIPDDRVLEEGDIVGLDIGVVKDGYYADAARTFPVGKIDANAQQLLDITSGALEKGIEQARSGNRLTDISHAVETFVTATVSSK